MVTSEQIPAVHWESELRDFIVSKPKKPLLVILGPTASGKTDFSIRMAEALHASGEPPEIINADSRQLYKHLDIGTAKITEKEMEGIPHHLLSILDPKEDLTIARFQELAVEAIDDIHSRGALPMLVGGSMLYISAIIDGLKPLALDPAVRERLSRDYDKDGGESLFRKLQEIDPESAAAIPKENKVYLLRALEIFESTGKTKSSQKFQTDCPYDLCIFGIEADSEVLKKRINERTEAMFASGWIDEVRGLQELGYTQDDPGMKSHGYREILEYIVETSGARVSTTGIEQKVLEEKISSQVRKYAKRQRTWWRGDARIQWITPA